MSASGKTILITGGNRGLGKALVETFAGAGWTVLATARNKDSVISSSSSSSPQIHAYALDLAQQGSLNNLVEELQGTPIDAIIHNAGYNPKDNKTPGYFESTFYVKDFDAANVAESLMINALHPMELTGKLLPNLTKDGAVVAISSWLGSMGNRGSSPAGHYAYCGSKALFNMCIKGLSMEFGKEEREVHLDGTTLPQRTAVALNPGWMATDMGGPNASTTPTQVAQLLLGMLEDGFLHESNGKFLNTDRTEHAW